jgi:hypothetical protein
MPGDSEDLVQVIQAESVDQRKLIRLLKEMYGESEGKGNFRIEVRATVYLIRCLPRLTLISYG